MRMTYDHPILDAAACAAQDRVAVLQGVNNTWYCGSHVGYGFHEDGLESGFAVADELGAPVPWRDAVTPASPADRRARPRPVATTQAAA
jgi:predicted NAD/FAD-binding protein